MLNNKLILLILSLVVLSACSQGISATNTPDGRSGIEGHVTIGPTCPGPVQVGDTTCQNQPFQAKITILDEDNAQVIQFTTDKNGYFKVSLNPGTYILHPESGDQFPIAKDQPVTVNENQFTEVNIVFDTGIR